MRYVIVTRGENGSLSTRAQRQKQSKRNNGTDGNSRKAGNGIWTERLRSLAIDGWRSRESIPPVAGKRRKKNGNRDDFPFFSVVFLPMAVPSTLSSRLAIVSRLTAKTQIAFISSVPSVYSVCSVVSLLSSSNDTVWPDGAIHVEPAPLT